MSPSKLREPLLRKQSKKGLLPTLAKPRSRAELKARCGRRHIRRMFGRADGPLPNRDANSDHPRFSAANMRVLVSTTLADLFTPLLFADLSSAVRASLSWRSKNEIDDGVAYGRLVISIALYSPNAVTLSGLAPKKGLNFGTLRDSCVMQITNFLASGDGGPANREALKYRRKRL